MESRFDRAPVNHRLASPELPITANDLVFECKYANDEGAWVRPVPGKNYLGACVYDHQYGYPILKALAVPMHSQK